MPVLTNLKRENYCRHRAGTLIPSRAAVAAGYAPGSAVTTELERDPEIQARIQELVDERMEKREHQRAVAQKAAEVVGEITGYSHAWVLKQLADNAINAASEGDFKESNTALKMIGEHLGMWGKGGDPNDPNKPQTLGEQLTDAAIERLDKLNEHLERFDPPEQVQIPDQRDIETLIGPRLNQVPSKDRELGNGSETDVALTAAAMLPHEIPEFEEDEDEASDEPE